MSHLAAGVVAEPVRQFGDPALRSVCAPVSVFDDALAAQAEMMIRLCERTGGVGLAGPQAGIVSRIFVMLAPDQQPRAVVNPRIVAVGERSDSYQEGCLSLGWGEVRVPVIRPVRIDVVATDLDGVEHEERLTDFAARIFQHEADHLDGILILERTAAPERRRALAELRR